VVCTDWVRFSLELMCVRDMLANLASVSNVLLPDPTRGTAQKRPREPEQAASTWDTTASIASTAAQDPRTVAGSPPSLEPPPVLATNAPPFGLPHAAEPGMSLGMYAQGPGSTPSGGWMQALAPPLPYGRHPGEHIINNSVLPVGAGISASAPVSGNASEQLAQWWTHKIPGAAAGYDPVPDGASGADLDAIGDALDALLSQSGHGGAGIPGSDPLRLWTQPPMDFG
jgi:hypothetical protein